MSVAKDVVLLRPGEETVSVNAVHIHLDTAPNGDEQLTPGTTPTLVKTGLKDNKPDLLKTEFVLVDYVNVADWLDANPFIATGYRHLFTRALAYQSIFRWHNETANIWSHVLGSVSCVLAFGYVWWGYAYRSHEHNLMGIYELGDNIMLSVWILAALHCVLMSSLFHINCCRQREIYHYWHVCDLRGIVLLISGSWFPIIYLGFCHWEPIIVYMTVCCLSSTLIILLLNQDKMHDGSHRNTVTVALSAFSLLNIIPLVHMSVVTDARILDTLVLDLVIETSVYFLGSIVYTKRWPECYLHPKSKWGWVGSHFIWHSVVVGAEVIHWTTLRKLILNRAKYSPDAC